MKSTWEPYQELELINRRAPSPSLLATLKTRIGNILSVATAFLTASGEPQIYLCKSANGEPEWYVYDPVTGYSSIFRSEDDVRVWLDQRWNNFR